MTEVEKNMEAAATKLLLENAFWASMLLKFPRIVDHNLPHPMGVNAAGKIYYNPEQIEELGWSVANLTYVLAHEVCHTMYQHLAREQELGLNHRLANIAQDACVNALLTADGIGEEPPVVTIKGEERGGVIHWPGAIDKTFVEVYREMQKEGMEDKSGEFDFHDLEGNPLTETEVKQMISQASTVAKMCGSKPGQYTQSLIDNLLNVSTPWYDKLINLATSITSDNCSWSKPNRRFVSRGLYMPSNRNQEAIDKMALIVDISGSVSLEEYRVFMSHIQTIRDAITINELIIQFWDTEMAEERVYSPYDELDFTLPVGGGTDMQIALESVEEEHYDADGVILFTDGYTPWPDSYGLNLFVVCTSEDVEAPVGETIYAEISV